MRLASALTVAAVMTLGCSKDANHPNATQAPEASVAAAAKKRTPEEWTSKLNSIVKLEQISASDDGNTSGAADFGDGVKVDYAKDGFRKLLHFGTVEAKFNTMSDGGTISCYVALKENSKPTFFLVNSYTGDNWLFMNKVAMMVDGQVVIDQNLQLSPEDRTAESGGVTERYDLPILSNDELLPLRKVATSKQAVARLTGTAGYESVSKKQFAKTQDDLRLCLSVYDKLDAALFDIGN